jgi:hypothetical protein
LSAWAEKAGNFPRGWAETSKNRGFSADLTQFIVAGRLQRMIAPIIIVKTMKKSAKQAGGLHDLSLPGHGFLSP